ncbi:unnamed protein product [Leptosia nina]|uniref:Major facilitator superfamily (MFS) profile domain-containing protein n=1 Tax=Leptosia nina TaxID=320188 RepID=A0AAV1IXY7_9NEOP
MVHLTASLRQYIIIISVNLTGIGMGMTFSWTSPMLVKLMNEDTQFSKRVTEEEASWLASLGFLCSIICLPGFYWLVGLLGRKKMMLYLSLARACVNMLYIFASEIWTLFIVRAATGALEIGILTNLPAYNAEIASKQIRGALGTMGQLSTAIGMLIMLSVGPYASYQMVNIVYQCVVTIGLIPLFFIPESPFCMLRKGRTDEALKILTYLRGSELTAQEEMKQMTAVYDQKVDKRILFKDIVFLKTLGIVTILSTGYQMIGYCSVTLYLQTILEVTGTSISSEVVSVIFGVMQIFACFVTTLLSDRAGRKPILVSTLAGMAVGMIGLGTFFFIKDSGSEIEGFLNYMPLISLVIIVLCFNAGMGSLSIVLSAELFDNPTRSIGICVTLSMTMLFGFLNLKYFPMMTTALGSATVFWSFAVICVLLLLFISFCVPETKRKTFLEIQKALGRKNLG